MKMSLTKFKFLGVVAVAGALALGGCGSSDPLAEEETPTSAGQSAEKEADSGETLVVGSQDYFSNEIIAEIYAQALEEGGFSVQREFRIGNRAVYMPEVQAGAIDIFPEYTGNLLQYLDPEATATSSEDVFSALVEVMPEGLTALDQAPATDQDSYVVTKEMADQYSLVSIGDLSALDSITLGGNSELEVRPYGPKGLLSIYGVEVDFTPIEDQGGPLTVKALRDGDVQLVNIYTSNPVFQDGDLVILEDPESMFLASHVVPLVSDRVDERAIAIINKVSAALTPEGLVALNAQSVNDKLPATAIAEQWLVEQNLDFS